MSEYSAPPIPHELIPRGVPCVGIITEGSAKFFEVQQHTEEFLKSDSPHDIPITTNRIRMRYELMEPFMCALRCMLDDDSAEQTVGECKLVKGYRYIQANIGTDMCIMGFLDWRCLMSDLSGIIRRLKIYEQEKLGQSLDEQLQELTIQPEIVPTV